MVNTIYIAHSDNTFLRQLLYINIDYYNIISIPLFFFFLKHCVVGCGFIGDSLEVTGGRQRLLQRRRRAFRGNFKSFDFRINIRRVHDKRILRHRISTVQQLEFYCKYIQNNTFTFTLPYDLLFYLLLEFF